MFNVGDLVVAKWRNGRQKSFEMTGRITQIDRLTNSYVVQGFDADGFPQIICLSANKLQKIGR